MDDFAIIRAKIAEKAKENNLELTDKADAVARAKSRFFGVKYWMRCPCDPGSDRACISGRCWADIAKNGVCHCNLYRRAA